MRDPCHFRVNLYDPASLSVRSALAASPPPSLSLSLSLSSSLSPSLSLSLAVSHTHRHTHPHTYTHTHTPTQRHKDTHTHPHSLPVLLGSKVSFYDKQRCAVSSESNTLRRDAVGFDSLFPYESIIIFFPFLIPFLICHSDFSSHLKPFRSSSTSETSLYTQSIWNVTSVVCLGDVLKHE